MLARTSLRATMGTLARAFHSTAVPVTAPVLSVAPALPELSTAALPSPLGHEAMPHFHRMPLLTPTYTFSPAQQRKTLPSGMVAASSQVPSSDAFNALVAQIDAAYSAAVYDSAVAHERFSKTVVPYAGALLAVAPTVPEFEMAALDAEYDSALALSAADACAPALAAAVADALDIDGVDADAIDSLDCTSVLRKRRGMMNRHKLKKRRRAERFRNRRTTK